MSIIGAGTSLIVGTVGEDGEPRATRAFALVIDDPASPLARIVMSADDPVAVGQLASGSIALTAAHVRTLRSMQLKGRVTLVEPATPRDVEILIEHTEQFFLAVRETDGHPTSLVRRMLPIEMVAVEFEVDEIFDQSPGPDAGQRVAVAP
jgi:hypothetical protein